MRKRIAVLALAASILTSCTATPTFAYTEENVTTDEYVVVVQDDNTTTDPTGSTDESTESTSTESTSTETDEHAEPVIDRSNVEPTAPLTPAGNMTLVDDVTVSSGTKQFLTLTTREGNFYYLIVDRDKNGNENVHFLNQVDERDLISLMNEDEAKELEEQLTRKAEEEKAQKEAAAAPKVEPEPTPEPTPAPQKTIRIAGYELPRSVLMIGGVALFLIIICLIAFIKLGKKKKAETDKPDPDADYNEDYDDEMDLEQGEWDEADYEE